MTCDRKYYETLINNYEGEYNHVSSINRRLSLIRLLLFLCSIIIICLAVFLNNWILYIPAFLLICSFTYVLVVHNKSKQKQEYLRELLNCTKLYIARMDSDFDMLPDDGEEFFNKDSDYLLDLDIFGRRSIYRLYNIAETKNGRLRFASYLKNEIDNVDITHNQKLIQELLANKELLLKFQAIARLGGINKSLNELDIAINYPRKNPISKKLSLLYKLALLLWLIPIASIIVAPKFISVSILLVLLVNEIFFFLVSIKYKKYFDDISRLSSKVSCLIKLFKLLEEKKDEIPLITKFISNNNKSCNSSLLESLNKYLLYVDLRYQPIIALLMNACYPYDLFVYDKATRIANSISEDILSSIDKLYEIEALMSLSIPGIISKKSSFPSVLDLDKNDPNNSMFDGKEIVHPLLNQEKAVSNSISINSKEVLITGSNMSGKTTLIRTIGILSVLSYCGAPVPCESLTLGRMRIVTSMRIVDSIEENMSTFKAELNRIARIVDASRENLPMMFLIDEIFRGTNSTDRTEGAMSVLKVLDKKHIMGLMTTHDYELCDNLASSDGNIAFYHFSEHYNDQGIIFDYCLHDGMTHQSNAKYLMKLVNIID